MLFCRVRDAPAGNNAVKCILLHNYIHTSAIISHSSAISTLIQGQNYIVSIYFSSLLTPSCSTTLISSPPPDPQQPVPALSRAKTTWSHRICIGFHKTRRDPVPMQSSNTQLPSQVTNQRVNNVKYNKHTPSTTLFDYKQFVSLP